MTTTSDRPPRWSLPARRRIAGLLGIALLVFVADQVSKAAVRATLHPGETWPEGWDLIRLSHVHNTGAAFGILQGASTFLVVVPLIAIAAITAFLLVLPSHSRWYSIALASILGGAIGNLTDRIRLGYVTDFIDPTRYPSFNVADSAIVLGVIAIAVLSFFEPTSAASTPEREPQSDTSDPIGKTEPSEVRT